MCKKSFRIPNETPLLIGMVILISMKMVLIRTKGQLCVEVLKTCANLFHKKLKFYAVPRLICSAKPKNPHDPKTPFL